MGKHGFAQMPRQQEAPRLRDDPRPARRGRPCLHEAVPADPGADALPALDRPALEEVGVHAARRNLTTDNRARSVKGDAVGRPIGCSKSIKYYIACSSDSTPKRVPLAGGLYCNWQFFGHAFEN
jgi:hypothetical protein